MTERYQITQLISKDQLGGVYLAEDTKHEQEVTFRHLESKENEIPSSEWEDSFRQYANDLNKLKTPYLLRVLNAYIDDGDGILISQYVKADTLAQKIQEGPLSVSNTITALKHILQALQIAHQNGIYHGALQTGSIYLKEDSEGNLTAIIHDLGLKELAFIVSGKKNNTEDPIFVAPETFQNPNAVNAQSDLFTVGQLAYSSLVGGHPFAKHTAEECAKAYKSGETIPIQKFIPQIHPALADWISKITAPNPQDRPASASEALALLEKIPVKREKSTPTQSLKSSQEINFSESLMPSRTALPTVKSKKKGKGKLLLVSSLLFLLGGGIFFATTHNSPTPKKKKPAHPNKEKITKPPLTSKLKKEKKNPLILKAELSPISTPLNKLTKLKLPPLKKDYDWLIPCTKETDNAYFSSSSPLALFLKTNLNTLKEKLSYQCSYPLGANRIQTPRSQSFIIPPHFKARWEVSFTPQPSEANSLWLTCYLAQNSSEFKIKLNYPQQSYSIAPEKLKQLSAGMVQISFQLPPLKAKKTHTLTITASSKSSAQKESSAGLLCLRFSKQKPQIPPSSKAKITKPAPQKNSQKKPSPKKTTQKKRLKTTKKKSLHKNPNAFHLSLNDIKPFTEKNQFANKNWNHGKGSIVQWKNKYYLFYARWPKSKGPDAKQTFSEIAVAESSSSGGPWTYRKTILKSREKTHWDCMGAYNPILKKFEQGYFLYYVSSSHIGCVFSKTFKDFALGKVSRSPKPIVESSPLFSKPLNPSTVIKTPEGDYLLIIKTQHKSKIRTLYARSAKPFGPFKLPETERSGILTYPVHFLWYNNQQKQYCAISRPGKKVFYFYSANDLTIIPKKRKGLNPSKFKSETGEPMSKDYIQFDSPGIFFDAQQKPETLIFTYSTKNNTESGIYTIPLKKKPSHIKKNAGVMQLNIHS